MYLYGYFNAAFRAPADLFRKLPETVKQWADDPELAQVAGDLSRMWKNLDHAVKKITASSEGGCDVLSCSLDGSAVVILNGLNFLAHRYPQVEMAVTGTVDDSITDAPAEPYAFYSPAGCDCLYSTREEDYDEEDEEGLEDDIEEDELQESFHEAEPEADSNEAEDTLCASYFEFDFLLGDPCEEEGSWNFPPEADWIPFL